MKTREAYTELSVQLASIQAKLDWLIKQQNKKVDFKIDYKINSTPAIASTCSRCGLYTCDGTKCAYSGHQLAKGDFADSGLAQEWRASGDLNV